MATYRADIDGLRALSILGVLGFHARLPFMPGGFLGVDIFFAISGFLITGILLAEHRHTGSISLRDFWARRIRRLAPALLTVLAVVLVMSVFLLERISGETGALSKAAIATLLLNANHFFLFEASDYFAPAAEHNPLLHMWSLSVEEQFYLVWPLVLSILVAFYRLKLKIFLTALFAISFLASSYWSITDLPDAFYLMPSRAWELLAGALTSVALHSSATPAGPSPRSGVFSLTGAILIGFSFCFAGEGMVSPVPSAVLPVLGAVLLLVAGGAGHATLASRAIGSSPMAYLGKISYPLYLWHWPILVFMRSRRLYEDSMALDLIGLLLALVLAVFTYEIVEREAWKKGRVSSLRTISYGFAGITVVLSMAIVLGLWVRFGIGYSAKEKILDLSRRDKADTGCLFPSYPSHAEIDRCFPKSDRRSILLWGDSHAEHWAPALAIAAAKLDVELGVITTKGCRPLPPPVRGGDCSRTNQFVLENLSSWRNSRKLAGVIISARWPEGFGLQSPSIADRGIFKRGEYYDRRATSSEDAIVKFEESLTALVRAAHAQGLRVLIVLPSPVQRYNSQHCLAVKPESDCFIGLGAMMDFMRPVEGVIYRVAGRNKDVHVIDPKRFMCLEGRCPDVLRGMIVYADDDHVTRSFSSSSAEQFSAQLQWLSGAK